MWTSGFVTDFPLWGAGVQSQSVEIIVHTVCPCFVAGSDVQFQWMNCSSTCAALWSTQSVENSWPGKVCHGPGVRVQIYCGCTVGGINNQASDQKKYFESVRHLSLNDHCLGSSLLVC